MRELELYIHIPFCVKKCAYCDFLSAPADRRLRDRYVRALTEEIQSGAPVSAPRRLSGVHTISHRETAHANQKAAQKQHSQMEEFPCKELAGNYLPNDSEYTVSSVFFGGGTPSLLPAEQIASILDALRSRFSFQDDAEITIECNPGTFDAENGAAAASKPEAYR
ncbi:MAG: hypothetical protein LUI07_09250, partial [Lachnospiraceae bacterium]|nr:hypothetical protein [Lachnospiraceae bacterium]